jgi:predicted transcriptional regulator YdeE
MLLGGLRRRHAFEAAESDIVAQWRELLERGNLPGQVGSRLYGVMCGHDSAGFEYMCAAEVESLAALSEGTGRMRVLSQDYAVFILDRRRQTLKSAWQSIFAWLAASRYDSAHKPDFEVYASPTDPLALDGTVEIWLGVVPKSFVAPTNGARAQDQ